MDRTRFTQRPVRMARQAHDIMPAHRPARPPAVPVHHKPPTTAVPQPLPAQHFEQPQPVASTPLQPATMATAVTADAPTVSIKITVPDSETIQSLLAWRPTTKQVVIIIVAFVIFAVGYQMGHHSATAATPQAASLSRTGNNA